MTNELDALAPTTEPVKLSTGALVELEPLRSRQFFKLLRILTRGALPVLNDMSLLRFDENTDASEFATRLVTLLLLAIPEAEDETIEFVNAMCKPVGLVEGRKLNKLDTERNRELWTRVATDLDNPELDDLVTIIETIVRREADDIQALGKRLRSMFELAKKTGQLNPGPTSTASPTPTSSEASPDTSTSSPASTAGPTTSSPSFPYDDSDNAWPPFDNDEPSPHGNGTSG